MIRPNGSQANLLALWSDIAPGTEVVVRRDDRSVLCTRTRSRPWQLGSGAAVILVEGQAGCYALDRVSLAGPAVAKAPAPVTIGDALSPRPPAPFEWTDVLMGAVIVASMVGVLGTGLAALLASLGVIP